MTFADKLRLIPTIPEDAKIDEYIDGRIDMVKEWHTDIQGKCTNAAQKGKTSLALSLRTYILKSNFITYGYDRYDPPPRWFYEFVEYYYDENAIDEESKLAFPLADVEAITQLISSYLTEDELTFECIKEEVPQHKEQNRYMLTLNLSW